MKTVDPIFFSILALGFLLTQLTSSLFFPALPSAAFMLHISIPEIKQSISWLFVGYLIGQILLPPLSEKFGRRPIMLTSCLGYACFAFLTALTSQHLYFILGYISTSFFAANFTSVSNSMFKDQYHGKHFTQIIAGIGVVMSLGPIIGSLAGTLLIKHFNWHAIFFSLSLYSFILFIFALLKIPETKINQHSPSTGLLKSYTHDLKQVLRHRNFIRPIILLASNFGQVLSLLASAPFIFIHIYHYSTVTAGLLLLLLSIPYTIGSASNLWLLKHVNRTTLIRCFSYLQILSIVILAISALIIDVNIYFCLICLMCFVLALGALIPLTKASCLATPNVAAGAVASSMKVLQTLGAISFTTIFAYLPITTLWPLVCTLAGTSMLIFYIYMILNKNNIS